MLQKNFGDNSMPDELLRYGMVGGALIL